MSFANHFDVRRSASVVFCACVFFALCCSIPQIAFAAEQVDNPSFFNWEPFPVGSKVTYVSVTESEGGAFKQEYWLRLKSKTKDKVVVERQVTTIHKDGSKESYPVLTSTYARFFQLRNGLKLPDPEKPAGLLDRGKETLDIAETKIETDWTKTKMRVEAGDMITTAWTSKQVPGGLVKSVSETPETKSVNRIALISLEVPQQGDVKKKE